ncbi:MAG: hypothetical protein ACLR9T_11295 [Thomasclavelia sp.]|uniref:hypothetical protein n=1 Tax=Thomasclavelia sp. TaxID=3025757 RepID=UPI0039A349FC
MKNRWIGLIVGLIVLTGCNKQDIDKPVVTLNIDISKLNQQRTVTKNMINFKDDDQGKHDLLMLMINSVDYYNLVSGEMKVTSTYLDNISNLEYEFQINIPEYKSYVYQISSNSHSEQVMIRDSEKMYFFTGDRQDLENLTLNELIEKKQISIEEINRDNNIFKFMDWSLTDRVEDSNISRVANDLYGDVAPYLFPEDIALRQLGIDYSSFTIENKTKFLDRVVFRVEGKINNDLYTEGGTISMLIDQQTGIVLEYIRNSNNSRVEMKMESISIDSDNEIDLYNKYIK